MSKPPSKILTALMLQALASGPVLVSELPAKLGGRSVREVQRARVALVESGRVVIDGSGPEALAVLGPYGPAEEARKEARARPGPGPKRHEEARRSRALLPKDFNGNEIEEAAAAGRTARPEEARKEARAVRKRPGPLARALDLVGDLAARLEESREHAGALQAERAELLARVAFLEALAITRRDLKPDDALDPRVSPHDAQLRPSGCPGGAEMFSPVLPSAAPSITPICSRTSESGALRSPVIAATSLAATSVALTTVSRSSEAATSTPQEIRAAAEEELRARKGGPPDNPEAWIVPKLRELARDRKRVLGALERKRVWLAAEVLARDAPARALAAKAAREAEEAERCRLRREETAREIREHREAKEKREASLRAFQALSTDAKADIEERVSAGLAEKGLRRGRPDWEAAFWDRVCVAVEAAPAGTATPPSSGEISRVPVTGSRWLTAVALAVDPVNYGGEITRQSKERE